MWAVTAISAGQCRLWLPSCRWVYSRCMRAAYCKYPRLLLLRIKARRFWGGLCVDRVDRVDLR